jgi:hypothetical protein
VVQSQATCEAGCAAKADDATLIFSGGCEHGPECWRGGEELAILALARSAPISDLVVQHRVSRKFVLCAEAQGALRSG